MEQRQYANRVAASAKRDLAEARALELEAKHPQISFYDNQPEHTEQFEARHGSGGEAGLARVIGKGKRKSKKAVQHEQMKEEAMMASEEEDEKYDGGARQGRMLARHMRQMYGGAFMNDFMKGYGSLSGGGGYQVAHAPMMSSNFGERGAALGGQDVPTGGITPIAYGNPPQAPASFERNTVGMGRAGGGRAGGGRSGGGAAGGAMCGKGQLTISHGEGMVGKGQLSITHGEGKKKRAPSQRNQMIAKLMKEKGMTLGEASKHLKQHGSA